MEFKGTPGPWRLTSVPTTMGNDREIVAAVKQTTLSGFTLILADRGPRTPEEADANARLLAAAPDLLEALQWAMSYVDYCEPSETAIPGLAADEFMQRQSKARAAIAKALGAEVAS